MATKKYTDRLDRQQIAELTGMLRYDPDWSDLKKMLVRKGLDPAQSLLAVFGEDEYGHEFGVVVTPDAKVYEYLRRTATRSSKGRLLQWHDRTGNRETVKERGTAVSQAVKLAKTGLTVSELIESLKKLRLSYISRDAPPEEKRKAVKKYLKRLGLSEKSGI
jgi:hypothetical protein